MEYKDSNIGKSRTEDKESLRRTQSDMTDQNSDAYQTATDEEDAADDEDEKVPEMTNSSSFEYPSRTSGTNNMKDFLTYRGSNNSSNLSSPPNSGDIEVLDDTDSPMPRERFFSSGAERSETEVMSKPSARQIIIKGRKVEQQTTSLSRQHSGVDRAEMTIEPAKRKVISITHKQTSVTTSSSSASVTPEFLEESRKRAAAAFNGPKTRIVNIPVQSFKSSQVVKSQVVEAKVRDFFESIKATLIDPERDLMKSFMNESNIEDMSMFSRKHDVLSHTKESNATVQHSMQPAAEMKLVPEDNDEPDPDYNSSSSDEEEECVKVEQQSLGSCADQRGSAEKTLMSIPLNAESDRMEEERQSEASVGRSQTFPSSPLVRKASLRQTRRRKNDLREGSPANVRSSPADVSSLPADVRTDLVASESISMKDVSAAMDNSLGHIRSNVKSLASKSVKKLEKPVKYNQSIDSSVPITVTRGKDMRRSKTNPKSNIETLKRIGKYQAVDRPSPDVKISDAQIEYLLQNYDKHEVVLRKEEGGFGLTLNGNGPVSVNYVKPDGIAFKNKVCVGDIIFKINGDLVIMKSHAEVVALVQKAGKDIALTLLRNQTNEPQQLAPIFKGEEMDVVSKPMLVAKEKDLELKESTVHTIRSMYESAVQELDALKADYQRNQSEDLSRKIENKLKVVSHLEVKLSNLTGVPIQPNSSASFMRAVQPGVLVTEQRRQKSKDNEQQTLSPPVPDLGRGMISPMIAEQPPKPVKPDIISLDMSDEDEKCPEFREFADIHTLKNNPAHLAIFLKYLILNHSPAPLLFTLITEYYSQSNAKEISNTTRWAYEIHNTFLVDRAPLQLKMIPPAMVKSIETVLKVAKENELKTIFQPPNNFIQKDLLDLLEEFRQKRSIGMGCMFGDHYLRDRMDRTTELSIVDKVLWEHFSEFVKDADNTKQAIAFGLMTVFRQIGFINSQNSVVMENCPSFVCKDKKALKNRLKKQVIHGHPVVPFQFPASTPVFCQQCRQTIWGIGCQGYRCSNCDVALHRLCLEKFVELCSGSVRKKDPVRMMRDIIPSLKTSREEPGSKFYGPQQHGFVEALDLRYTSPAASEDRELEQRSLSDDERPVSTKTTNHTRSSSMNISGMSLSLRVAPELLDSDFEVESELPPLVTVISKEDLHKMKPKERKRQEIINELFYTERSHVRTLKVMDRVFVQRMKADPQFKDYVELFFPNLDRIIKIHRELNNDFKARKKQQPVVTRVGDILMKHFSGDNGDTLKNQCAHFCKDQSFALEYLRQAQRKDPYLAQFIQNAALDPLCKKQELKDFVLKIMVRLTKYPLLVDSLIKCTPPDTEEITSLQDVLPLMKGVLHFINQIVKECENYRRSQSMQKRLDHKPIENSKNPVLIEHKNLDMTKHTIIYDGDLTWVLNDKSVDLHVVLFTDLFVILHKQDNRLVLRCINTSIEDTKYQHVPIIRLTGLMIRDIPRDNHAFHLINASKEDSQMYKMVAKSKEERDNWCKYIREAVENFKNQYSSQQSQTSQTSQSTLSNLSTTSNDHPDSAGSIDSNYDALDSNSSLAPIDLVLESMECTESCDKLIHPSEVVFNEVEERSSVQDLPAGPEYELKKRVLAIQTQMAEKMKALCDIHHTTISCDNRPTSLKLSMDCQQFMETAIAMVVYMTQFFSELPEELSDPEGSVAESEYIDSLLALGEELKKLVQQLEEIIRVKEDAEKSDVPTNLLKNPGSPEQPRYIRPTSYTVALSSDFSLDETDSSDKNTDKNT